MTTRQPILPRDVGSNWATDTPGLTFEPTGEDLQDWEGYIYCDVPDIAYQIGDIVPGRRFTSESIPITIEMVRYSIVVGATAMIADLAGAHIRKASEYKNDNALGFATRSGLRQANTLASCISLLDTIPVQSDPSPGRRNKNRKELLQAKYRIWTERLRLLLSEQGGQFNIAVTPKPSTARIVDHDTFPLAIYDYGPYRNLPIGIGYIRSD